MQYFRSKLRKTHLWEDMTILGGGVVSEIRIPTYPKSGCHLSLPPDGSEMKYARRGDGLPPLSKTGRVDHSAARVPRYPRGTPKLVVWPCTPNWIRHRLGDYGPDL